MSAERIDHAKEAADMLTGANPHGSPQEALAHATLALVQQQRIANLLALSQWRVESGDGPELFTTSESAMKLRIEAWTALGLEVTE